MTGSGDEAIQTFFLILDCFASVAMTGDLAGWRSREMTRRQTHFINVINPIAIAPQS
jgi:hypothetical protein